MELKDRGKKFVARTARGPVAWPLYKLCGRLSDSLGRIYGHARFTREVGERDETLRKLTQEMFPELTVAGGPFKGMRYPSGQSYGSALLPKLLGSYESELHAVLEEMLTNQYTAIVDIGCAEGYYAVGLGLRVANADVYAFDISTHARKICGDMAQLNRLDGRAHIGGFCDEAVLRSISLGSKALIISDCEGYEGTLFTREVADFLARHDIIVETHDFIDIDISSRLRDVFARTHQIRSIKSIDDIEKAHTYRYSQLDRYDTMTKRLVLGERRPAIMEWLVMTPR
ncbi:MAG: hypothetical protein WBD25_06560 [Terriglobales bacterium]|jgi:hypothetical protein